MKATRSRFRALFQLSTNFSEASLASLVLPAFLYKSIADIRLGMLILGLGFTAIFVVLALLFAEKGRA